MFEAHAEHDNQGKLVKANGDVYEGGWLNGQIAGHGPCTAAPSGAV